MDNTFPQPTGIEERFVSAVTLAAQSAVHPNVELCIARWAARLVQDGDTIILDASRTVLRMAPFLAQRRELFVITNGIPIAQALAANPINQVLLVGGFVQSNGKCVLGSLPETLLRGRPPATAFVSCQGFSAAAGLTESDCNEALVKREMVALAQTSVALIESHKFGLVFPTPFARADQIAHIFSDVEIEAHWAQQVQEASIVLTVCLPATEE